jgi:hypothetical protein
MPFSAFRVEPGRRPPSAMTSQGTAFGRFTRAIAARNLFQAELALREMCTPSLLVALDSLELLADVKPEKLSEPSCAGMDGSRSPLR